MPCRNVTLVGVDHATAIALSRQHWEKVRCIVHDSAFLCRGT